jgi:cytochrome P450
MDPYLNSTREEREALVKRRAERDDTLSNREMADAWAIDPHHDPYALDLDAMDPSHPTLFLHGTHWKHFERLRAEDPVHRVEHSQFGPYWAVTKYEDIKSVDQNHRTFSSSAKTGGISIAGMPQREDEYALPMFIAEDQPKHDDQRKVVTPLFAPRQLADLEPLIRERACAILDDLPRGEEFNWVRHVSVELTAQMLATLFDVPQEDRLKLIDWSDTIQSLSDPDEYADFTEGFQKLFECRDYFRGHFEARKNAEPKFDLLSLLAHDPSTRDMDDAEFLGNIMLLIVGGNDTTRNSISGGVLALNQNPDEYAKLRADPSVIPNMVSEIIRWQSPVAHMARTATEDTELGGKHIRAGDRVAMWYVSGNRDEDAMADANTFRIDRPNARQHTSFGYGIHRCVGNRLAEMQLRTIWEEIVKRFDVVEVTGEPVGLASSFIHGIRELPVTLRERA